MGFRGKEEVPPKKKAEVAVGPYSHDMPPMDIYGEMPPSVAPIPEQQVAPQAPAPETPPEVKTNSGGSIPANLLLGATPALLGLLTNNVAEGFDESAKIYDKMGNPDKEAGANYRKRIDQRIAEMKLERELRKEQERLAKGSKPSDKVVLTDQDGDGVPEWTDVREAPGTRAYTKTGKELTLEEKADLFWKTRGVVDREKIAAKKGEKTFDQERKMYAEREGNKLTNDTREIVAANERLQSATFGASPFDDVAAVFAIFKMLDPGSVVRESEQATGIKARSYQDFVANAKTLLTGERKLTPPQIEHLRNLAKRVVSRQLSLQEKYDASLANQARKYGLRPEQIINRIESIAPPKKLEEMTDAELEAHAKKLGIKP